MNLTGLRVYNKEERKKEKARGRTKKIPRVGTWGRA